MRAVISSAEEILHVVTHLPGSCQGSREQLLMCVCCQTGSVCLDHPKSNASPGDAATGVLAACCCVACFPWTVPEVRFGIVPLPGWQSGVAVGQRVGGGD